MDKAKMKKALKDFWYGKPHGERRLGDLLEDKTGLYKHREWRGVKDTMYYFNNIWLYNYGMMVADILKSEEPLAFFKGVWRYRWVGQTYLPVLHWLYLLQSLHRVFLFHSHLFHHPLSHGE